MDLVTFSSKNESTYLSTLLDDEVYWAGMIDIWIEGSFRSYNNLGDIVTSFVNWNPGEPSNSGDEDCVIIGKPGSNDRACDSYQKVLCERKISKKPATKINKSIAPEPAANRFDYVSDSGIILSFKQLQILLFLFQKIHKTNILSVKLDSIGTVQ